jgi:hypothetical protein
MQRTPNGETVRPRFQELVGDPGLAPGRLVDGERDHGFLDRRIGPVLEDRLAPREFLQRQLAAFVVELLEAIEAVPAIAHHLAGLGDIAELLGQLEHAHFGADDLLVLGHGRCPLERRGRALRTPTTPRPASAHASAK